MAKIKKILPESLESDSRGDQMSAELHEAHVVHEIHAGLHGYAEIFDGSREEFIARIADVAGIIYDDVQIEKIVDDLPF